MKNPPLVESEYADGPDAVFVSSGITLRDLYAGFALAGMLARDVDSRPDDVEAVAFQYADSMLSERERR